MLNLRLSAFLRIHTVLIILDLNYFLLLGGLINYLSYLVCGLHIFLYYLFSEKQTITKEEILHRLIEEDIWKQVR